MGGDFEMWFFRMLHCCTPELFLMPHFLQIVIVRLILCPQKYFFVVAEFYEDDRTSTELM